MHAHTHTPRTHKSQGKAKRAGEGTCLVITYAILAHLDHNTLIRLSAL